MNYLVDPRSRHGFIGEAAEHVNARFKQPLKPRSDDAEGQPEDKPHDADEEGDRSVFAGQIPIDFLAAQPFPALPRLRDCLVTYFLDKRVPHIRDGGASVESALIFHLPDNVLHGLCLILIKSQLRYDQ